jgi:hypothetical protein
MTIRGSALFRFLLITAVVLSGLNKQASPSIPIYTRTLDCNNIGLGLNNIGTLWNGNPSTSSLAVWYSPDGSLLTTIVYNQGFWVIGKILGKSQVALAQWNSVYSPGPIIGGKAAMVAVPQDSLKYRVYRISPGDSEDNPDYAEWPADMGAPLDGQGRPKPYGNQSLWTVYNALDPNVPERMPAEESWLQFSEPMPLEIRQIAFAKSGHRSDRDDVYSNTVMFEWTVINKGVETIDSAYVGLWADIDFSNAHRNLPGIDTTFQTAYCWEDEAESGVGLDVPPAVGYTLLYGPAVPAAGHTAVFKGRSLVDHRNLGITAFHGIADAFPEDSPRHPVLGTITSLEEAWNAAKGLNLAGMPYREMEMEVVNEADVLSIRKNGGATGEPVRFPLSGDPVTGKGWIYPEDVSVGGESGFVFFSGPFTLAAGDTQWVMAALVPALGESNRMSVHRLREHVYALQSEPYESLIVGRPADWEKPEDHPPEPVVLRSFRLFPNYPNPFNAGTVIPFEIPDQARVILEVLDINGRLVDKALDAEFNAGYHTVHYVPKKLPSGVYFIRMKSAAAVQTRKMVLLK